MEVRRVLFLCRLQICYGAGQLQALFGSFLRSYNIPVSNDIYTVRDERPSAQRIMLRIAFQKLTQPVSQLLKIIASLPEPPGDGCNSQTCCNVRSQCPVQSFSKVIKFIIQLVEPKDLVRAIQFWLSSLYQAHQVSQVFISKSFIASRFQCFLPAILADGL